MNPIELALLPNGILMCVGAVLAKRINSDIWLGIDKLNFQLLFPALIFYSAASRKPLLDEVLIIGTGALAITLSGCLLALPLRKLQQGPKKFLDFAGVWQTTWRFNAAIAMVAIQVIPEQSRGLMSLAIGFAVPLANILAVLALSHGQAMPLSKIAKSILLNPFLVASIGGLLASNINIYTVFDNTLIALANTATPLALLSIGASINLNVLAKIDLFSFSINSIKLFLLPAITLIACQMLKFPQQQIIVLTLFAALPTASSAHLLANAFGADRRMTATIIAQSTLLACLSLPLWISFLIH
jgi:predicted permease